MAFGPLTIIRFASEKRFLMSIYESFEQYVAKVTFPKYNYDLTGEDFLRRTHLGWQGQIVSGAIGTAVEGYVTENIR